VLNGNGLALDSLGNHTHAIQYYDRSLAINPNDADALSNKGSALDDLGNHTQAIQYYDKALAINPNDTATLSNKGLALNYLGKHVDAISYYDKALAINPNDATILSNKGSALDDLGNHTQAIQYYDKALDINPGDSTTLSKKKADVIAVNNSTTPTTGMNSYASPSFVRNSTATNMSSGNVTSVPVTSTESTSATNTYTNSSDGISVTVPQEWGAEAGRNDANATLLVAIHMTPPLSKDPNALTSLDIYKDSQPTTASSVSQYLRDEIDGLRASYNSVKIISANTGNVTIAGRPGYQIHITYTIPNSGPFEVQETGFLLNGNAYYTYYAAPPSVYSTLLPQVNPIIKSMKVNPS
jgi:tetratricopeptide (TPR) repeat protein